MMSIIPGILCDAMSEESRAESPHLVDEVSVVSRCELVVLTVVCAVCGVELRITLLLCRRRLWVRLIRRCRLARLGLFSRSGRM